MRVERVHSDPFPFPFLPDPEIGNGNGNGNGRIPEESRVTRMRAPGLVVLEDVADLRAT